jgi:hypothetical protein
LARNEFDNTDHLATLVGIELYFKGNRLTLQKLCLAQINLLSLNAEVTVVSMIMHYLHNKKRPMKNNPGESMAIAMDNWGCQNKNNNVLRLAPHRVEMGFCRQCEFDFYIRGHTKNACDRTFNQMKLRFHKSNVFSYQQLLDSFGQQDNVTIINTT